MSNLCSTRRLILVLCFSVSFRTTAQKQVDEMPDRFHAVEFLHRLQDSLRAHHPTDTAALMHYPLRADIRGKSKLIRSKPEFVRDYEEIFTFPRIQAILNCKDAEIWWRDQGYSIPSGVIWFDDFKSSGAHPIDAFRVLTINQAKEEAR